MTRPTCDVAVIGGGLLGAATCYELLRQGATVTLVDRRDAGRATDAGAGILSPDTAHDPDPGWYAFARRAGDHYPALVAQLAEDGEVDTGYGPCGLLSIVRLEHEEPWFDAFAEVALARAPGLLREVGADEARQRFPPLGEVRRALYHPAAARVDGRRMSAALLGAARRRGLVELAASARGVRADGSRARAVATDRGDVACGALVVTGGAWSGELAAALATPMPVHPLKGQILHLALPATGADTGEWPIVQPVLGFYLVPWPEGRVACGGTMEADAGFDARPTASGARQLLRECLTTAPGLADATMVELRVGLRPASHDGRPLLGAVPGWENVAVATGHGTEGLLLGPYSAHLVARGVIGEDVRPALEGFEASRAAA